MNVEEAVQKRVSVRKFDSSKKVNKEDMTKILEAGRLAPNGFGLEAWTFNVIENNLDKLVPAVNNQKQAADASFAIAFSAPTNEFLDKNIDIIKKPLLGLGYPEANVDSIVASLGDYKGTYVREQTFFAAAQMMLQAADLGIGTNALGGYDNNLVCEFLNISPSDEQITLVVLFGYPDGEVSGHPKKALADVVKYY